MQEYVRRRLMTAVPVLIGVTFAVFMMLHFVPGDPVMMILTESRGGGGPIVGEITQETIDNMRHQLGLDRSLPVQYGLFIWRAAQGDLGRSFASGRSVTTMLQRNVPHTVTLAVTSLAIAIVVGLVLGVLAAVNHGSWLDSLLMTIAMVGVSIPNFWFGIMLLLVFALQLGWLPAIASASDWRSIVLPGIALGISASAIIARLARSSLIEVMHQDYVRTARAKGNSTGRAVVRHALKNSLIPVVTIAGLQFGNLLSGSVVVEVVFGRPGIGQMILDGIYAKDFPVVQGAILFVAVAYVLVNLLVDLLYARLDPRISFGATS